MIKIKFLLASLLLCTAAAHAQTYKVEGSVVDSLGTPEPYVTVRIFQMPDSVKPVAVVAASEDGKFSKTLKSSGNYRAAVASVGKKGAVAAFTLTQEQPVATLRIILNDANDLGEVVVEANKPLISREIDRIAYDVQADPMSRNNMLEETLRNVPLVSVDPDGTIKVKGSSDFKIYKNGRPNRAFTNNAKEIFKSLPASMIKKIEVITDPGAREDAEGVGMILNIITMENTIIKGVIGSVGLYYRSSSNVPNPNVWLTTQINKVNISANASFSTYPSRSNHQVHTTERTFDNSDNHTAERTEQRISTTGTSLGLEASYDINPLNLITAEFSAYISNKKTKQWFDFGLFEPDNDLIYSYSADGLIKPDRTHWLGGSINYQHQTHRQGEKIILSYLVSGNGRNYTWFNDYENITGNMPYDYKGIHTTSDATFLEHTVQLDWTRPLAKGHTLDIGAKYIYRDNNSKADQDYIGTTNRVHTDFTHTTQVAAAYFDYRADLGKIGFRAGLRYEFARLEAEFNDNSQPGFHSNLSDWVPNAAFGYMINQSNSMRIYYSTYINRPGINYLNPMVNRSPQSISYGNPDLGSVRNQSVNFNYSYFTRKFSLDMNFGYSFAHNAIIDIKGLDGDVLVNTFANGGRNKSYSGNIYMQWQMTKKTTLMLNGGTGYSEYANPHPGKDIFGNDIEGYSANGWSTNLYFRLSQRLPWSVNLSAYISYYSGNPGLYSIFKAVGASRISHGLSLQKSLLKENRLSMQLSVSNPFGPARSKYSSYMINVPYDSHSYSLTSNNRSVSISISYRFGKLNAQVKKVRRVSNNDLIGGPSR
ncbi:MAG: TonB-dependent receptor family protein [Paramuribaculum sp.]|nr:TonB-dependent receptor family protein [Paramuribaculum sp.]